LTTILLLESDPAAAAALTAKLGGLGHTVILASTGEQAVALAGSGQAFDLALVPLDAAPPLDGPQAARDMLRVAGRDVPVVFFASGLDPEVLARARSMPRYGLVLRRADPLAWQSAIEVVLDLFAERQRLLGQVTRGQERAGGPSGEGESEGRLHQILSALREAVWLRDVQTRQVLYVSPAFEEICGLPREAFYQDPNAFINLIHPDDRPWIMKGSVYRSDVHRIIRPDGGVRWVWGRTFPVRNAAGEVYRTAAIVEDITQRRQTEDELKAANERLLAQVEEIQRLQADLRDQAIRDPLTGLYNRRYLSDTLDRELARAAREHYPVSLAIIDCDGFKQVNDTHGHLAGDLVLKQLGRLLGRQTRASDLVCRVGGDEFLWVFPNLAASVAAERAEQCRRAFEESAVPFGPAAVRATVSIGIATFPDCGATSRELLMAADRALYLAKSQGRNRVVNC